MESVGDGGRSRQGPVCEYPLLLTPAGGLAGLRGTRARRRSPFGRQLGRPGAAKVLAGVGTAGGFIRRWRMSHIAARKRGVLCYN